MKDLTKTTQGLLEEISTLKQRNIELERSEAARKSAEEALRINDMQLHTILESTCDAILAVDGVGNVIKTNQKFIDLWDMPSELLKGGNDEALLTYVLDQLADPDAFIEKVNALYKSTTENFDTILFKDGRIVERYSCPLLMKGTINGRVWSFRDVTEHKKAEQALRNSESKYQFLAESMADVVFTLDLNLLTTYVSPSIERMLGYTPEERMVQKIDQQLTPKSQKLAFETLAAELNRENEKGADPNRFQVMELEYYHKDGSIRDLVTYIRAIRDNKGNLTGIYGSHHDITERKRADEALRESEVKYRSIFETTLEGIYQTSSQGRYIRVNPAFALMLGYDSPEDLIGSISDFVTQMDVNPDRRSEFKQHLSEQGRVENFEALINRKDGTTMWGLINGVAVRDEGSEILYYQGGMMDITERKRAEDLLRESENRFKALAENIPGVIYLCRNDQYYSMLYLNDAVEQLTGYGKDDFLENRISFVNLYHPDDAPSIGPVVEQACERHEPFHLIYRICKRDGQWRWIEEYGVGVYSQGNLLFLEGFLTDITDRKGVEEALGKSEDRLRLITDSMSDMIRVTDLQGVNLYTSPSHFKNLGYKPEERVGKSAFDIVHPDDMERIINLFSESLAANRRVTVEYRVRHADGYYVWLETVGDLLRDAQGKTTAIVSNSRDISDRKRAEEENRSLQERLQRSEKMEALGQLAGGVAHDLNNVLGVLTGYSELLLGEIPEGQRSRGYAEKILQSTEKGAAIIQDLLTLARRGVTASEVVNLNSVVSDFLKTPVFENIKNYHPHVTFRTECDSNLLNIKGSPVHLEKTLMNLVSNAAESISGKGEVTIRTESRYLDKTIKGYDELEEGDYAVLTVSDTGTGISAENREKIFEPFYTKKTMGRSGTGLGLAIVWGTVKDHNGYIDLQTEVGEGTTFTLYFPVTQEELIAQQQKMPIERYMGKEESVLVVDDIAEQRDIAARLLTRLGYSVRVVSSGEEAVEYLRGNQADILVLDMIMAPGMDGLETYQRVLSIYPKQKAILVSGFSETDRVKKAQSLGAGAYVKKPYVMEKIGIAIRDELNR